MSVFRVGQGQCWDQLPIAGHEAIPDIVVHQAAGSFQLLGSKIRPVLQEVPNPLFVDLVGPLGTEQVRHGELHQQVAERCRIENAGVVEGSETTHDQ